MYILTDFHHRGRKCIIQLYHYMIRNWLWLPTGLHQHIRTTEDKNCETLEGQLRFFGEFNEKKQESLNRKLQNTNLNCCTWFSKQNITEIKTTNTMHSKTYNFTPCHISPGAKRNLNSTQFLHETNILDSVKYWHFC